MPERQAVQEQAVNELRVRVACLCDFREISPVAELGREVPDRVLGEIVKDETKGQKALHGS